MFFVYLSSAFQNTEFVPDFSDQQRLLDMQPLCSARNVSVHWQVQPELQLRGRTPWEVSAGRACTDNVLMSRPATYIPSALQYTVNLDMRVTV